jgi:hypothetical protein
MDACLDTIRKQDIVEECKVFKILLVKDSATAFIGVETF